MNNDKLVIIDGNSLLFRSYFAMRPMVTKDGLHTQGIFAFINSLEKIIDEFKPDYIVVAFDVGKKTFRHKVYQDYKAGRQKTPKELLDEIPILHDILSAMNIKIMELEMYEADDIIGTVTKEASALGIKSMVITGDKDELQLIDENVRVLINKRGMTEFDIYDEEAMKERYGLTPLQFIDLKGLMGDSSDNLPGVYGVGEKKGISLLKEYKTLDNIIKNKDEIKGKLGENIRENVDDALMTRELATINRDVPIDIIWDELIYEEPDYKKLSEIYKKLEFNSFLKKLPAEGDSSESEFESDYLNIKTVNMNEFLTSLSENDIIFIHIKDNNDHLDKASIETFSIFAPDKNIFSSITTFDIDELRKILEQIISLKCEVAGHGLKDSLYSLKSIYGSLIDRLMIKHDTEVAEYILEPNRSRYDVDKMLLSYYGDVINQEDEDGEEHDFVKKNLLATWKIMLKQVELIEENGLSRIFSECELPLIQVLSEMEVNGIKVDEGKLIQIGKELDHKISTLSEEIKRLSGKSFNISSPKQLATVLFDEMKLPYPSKITGKTKYSTSKDILEKISDEHEIIPMILSYRKYTKLKSTYIDGLIKLIAKDGRIHPHFQQTVAATGRLSCTEPNLQNIPFRDDYGRLIRKAFVADKDMILVSADYSQIELRILASLSRDEEMIKAFNEGKDIHRITASRVFDVPIDEVTPELRSRAKAVNFGIIYGMSGFGLSEDIHVSRREAEKYIKDYFDKHPAVKQYLDEQIETGRKERMVRTLYGRIRQIPEFASRKYMEREQAKRLAMNTPIQGTAADIIKFAMNSVYRALIDNDMKSRLILQIHDELIIEAYKEELVEVKKILKDKMESATDLAVKLITDINSNESWYDMK